MPWFAGISRSEIDWGPTIDAKKCVGCGRCPKIPAETDGIKEVED